MHIALTMAWDNKALLLIKLMIGKHLVAFSFLVFDIDFWFYFLVLIWNMKAGNGCYDTWIWDGGIFGFRGGNSLWDGYTTGDMEC